MGDQKVLRNQIPELTLITDSEGIPNEKFLTLVDAALSGGVDAVLVREKKMDSARLLAFSSALRELTNAYRAKLIIHTQADIARAVNADGVHLSSNEVNQIPRIREWLDDKEMFFSSACHNESELRFAADFGADFAFLSPVFPTRSHPGAPHLGVSRFKNLAASSPLPVVALGGINTVNRSQLEDFSVAVIRSILGVDDPKIAAKELLRRNA